MSINVIDRPRTANGEGGDGRSDWEQWNAETADIPDIIGGVGYGVRDVGRRVFRAGGAFADGFETDLIMPVRQTRPPRDGTPERLGQTTLHQIRFGFGLN